ncbi:MAG: hypothetical protein MJY61_05255 [Bacteroidales bacterium]|nr:hypothetical protein [Bacteroidales bacterium]
MKRTYKYIIALLAVALPLAVASCTKDQPAVTEEGESLRYLTGVTDSTVFYTIDELTDYLAEKSLGDRTGIGKTVLELLYSRSIIKMLERNYLDVGLNQDLSNRLIFERYIFNYQSTDENGDPIILSGSAIFPNNQEGATRRWELDNVTLFSSDLEALYEDCPSIAGSPAMLRVLFNSLVVIPDFEGYGVSANRAHPIFHSRVLARQAIDCELAAIELARLKRADLAKNYATYNIGVSYGGMTALQVHKQLETTADRNIRSLVNITSTYCSSPLLDVNTIIEDATGKSAIDNPWRLTSAMKAAVATGALPDSCRISTLMSEGYNNTKVKVDGEIYTLQEMLDTKIYDFETITSAYYACDFKTVKAILSEELTNGYSGMESTALFKEVYKAISLDNPAYGWTPSRPVLIEHSQNDEVIPYYSTFYAYEDLKYGTEGQECDKVKFNQLLPLAHNAALIEGFLRILSMKDPTESLL